MVVNPRRRALIRNNNVLLCRRFHSSVDSHTVVLFTLGAVWKQQMESRRVWPKSRAVLRALSLSGKLQFR